MKHDIHIHIPPGADEETVRAYGFAAEMLDCDLYGFVVHHGQSTSAYLRYLDSILSTYSISYLLGWEVRVSRLFRSGELILAHPEGIVDAEVARKLVKCAVDVLAHPFSYGAHIHGSAVEVLAAGEVAVEVNGAHPGDFHRGRYLKLSESGVSLVFGSDAHSPGEMGSGWEIYESLRARFRLREKGRVFVRDAGKVLSRTEP
jgi:histidinol phosphatase-like PHP family hydrolase